MKKKTILKLSGNMRVIPIDRSTGECTPVEVEAIGELRRILQLAGELGYKLSLPEVAEIYATIAEATYDKPILAIDWSEITDDHFRYEICTLRGDKRATNYGA